jgi:AraC family transcriptional regulator
MTPSSRQTQLGRIEQVLNYIHGNLDQPLAVSSLAARAGWSRWQFNRVFSDQTGQSVGQYVRELRLSLAAEMLLFTRQRVIDIGLACGFGSDVSFTRSFTRHFGCPPAQYRRRGLPCLLTTPLCSDPNLLPPHHLKARIPTIRLDSRPAFEVTGKANRVRGLFSESPNFKTRVPQLWQSVTATARFDSDRSRIGVLDLSRGATTEFTYLAGAETDADAPPIGDDRLCVPAQNYVIVSFCGPLSSLAEVLRWFFRAWLPHAGCKAIYGFDLEIYPADFDPQAPEVNMEYWIPVTLSEPLIARHAPIG